MAHTTGSSDDAGAMLERLNSFASQYSRAEVARKTGFPFGAVNRYLTGTRVPAEFCMALVREFGVNPGWLLAGEGPPFVSDLARNHQRMAGDLLELVEAMSAVAKVRLGSLAGRDHMKMLRDLNGALGTYERLREKLNDQSREVFVDVLTELKAALNRMDMARMGSLIKAAEQVSRLCDDEELAEQLLGMRALHVYLTGNKRVSVELQRKRFVRALGASDLTNDKACLHALRLVVQLTDSGRIREARRFAEAVIALGGEQAARFPNFATLCVFYGRILVETGDIGGGLAALQRWLPRVPPEKRSAAQASLAYTQVLAGVVSLEEALQLSAEDEITIAVDICHLAIVAEDEKILRRCARLLHSEEGRVQRGLHLQTRYAPLLARALGRQDKTVVRELDKLEASSDEMTDLKLGCYACQIARVLGDRARAKRLWSECEKVHTALPQPEAALLPTLALHHLNALLLKTRGEAAARRFFEKHGECRFGHPALQEPQAGGAEAAEGRRFD